VPETVSGLVVQRENALRVGEENLAFCGKFEPPAVSFKEPSPDLLLKLPDLNAHCGLREIYEARGACEASGFRSGGERTQGGDVKKHAILVAKIWLASISDWHGIPKAACALLRRESGAPVSSAVPDYGMKDHHVQDAHSSIGRAAGECQCHRTMK
jgi:hypothetical protein